jgi:hypothetical protein
MSGSMMGMGRMSMSLSGMGGAPSLKASSTRAPSLLGMTATMNSLSLAQQQQQYQQQPSTSSFPGGHPQSIPEIPPPSQPQGVELHDPSDRTPTDTRRSFLPDLQSQDPGPMDYSPIDRSGPFGDASDAHQPRNYQNAYHPQQQQYQASVPDVLRPGPGDESANGSMSAGTWNERNFYSDSTPYHSYDNTSPDPNQHYHQQGQLGIANPEYEPSEPSWTMVSQDNQQGGYGGEPVTRFVSNGSYDSGRGGYGGGGGGGGLRVANRDSTDSSATEDSWRRDVLAQMNFAGGPGQGQGQQGGHHAQ